MAIQLFTPKFRVEECLDQIRICLEKGWTGLGFKTVEFEEAWKQYTGLLHAHFLNSATVGLHLAVQILKEENGWQDGDEIISTPLTFVSTNHVARYEKLSVVFADVDQYLCLDPDDVERKITPKTKAVLFVGLGGNTGQYERIVELCKKHHLALILDAAHMAGTRLHGVVPGKDAAVVVYSYQAVKNLPTADSGMICFSDPEFDAIARKKAWLGINKDTFTRTNDKGTYKWKYDVEYTGYKYHGNSIMAGIGLVQLRYLDQDNSYRQKLAQWYEEALAGLEDRVSYVPMAPGCDSSRHLFQIIVPHERDQLMQYLNEHDIYPGVHYRDNTEYAMYSYAKGTCPQVHRLSEQVLSLPMHLNLQYEDVQYITQTLEQYYSK